TIIRSPVTPVKSVYDFVDTKERLFNKFIVGAGEEDMKRYSYFEKNRDKYPNVEVVAIPPQFGRISGSQTRQLIITDIDKAIKSFVPSEISLKDRKLIKQILTK
ncbi:hypothetical protein EBU95_21390, partial [bacterium]|nr:hypothetical protein [bacterium]